MSRSGTDASGAPTDGQPASTVHPGSRAGHYLLARRSLYRPWQLQGARCRRPAQGPRRTDAAASGGRNGRSPRLLFRRHPGGLLGLHRAPAAARTECRQPRVRSLDNRGTVAGPSQLEAIARRGSPDRDVQRARPGARGHSSASDARGRQRGPATFPDLPGSVRCLTTLRRAQPAPDAGPGDARVPTKESLGEPPLRLRTAAASCSSRSTCAAPASGGLQPAQSVYPR